MTNGGASFLPLVICSTSYVGEKRDYTQPLDERCGLTTLEVALTARSGRIEHREPREPHLTCGRR